MKCLEMARLKQSVIAVFACTHWICPYRAQRTGTRGNPLAKLNLKGHLPADLCR